MKALSIQVFGKKGCDKCKVLNKRLDKLLTKEEWAGFEKEYHDISTVEGLVNFADSEFLNPQRIPAFVVCRKEDDDSLTKIPQLFEEGFDEQTGEFMYPSFVGLQTDYSQGGGVISPKMIESTLKQAQEYCG